jgi:hypothetical protein
MLCMELGTYQFETLLNHISWLYNCVNHCALPHCSFFHCLKGSPIPLSDQFWTSAVGPFVQCTPGVYWFAVSDSGCFKKQQVLWGRSLLFCVLCIVQHLDDTKCSSCWVLWWTQDAVWKNVLVPQKLNNENIKFACFNVVRWTQVGLIWT